MSAPSLRPYQVEALDAICQAFAKGQNRLLVQAATGVGKTTVFSALIRWPALMPWFGAFPESDRRVLIIAHRDELIDQAMRRIQQMHPSLYVSVEQGERYANRHSHVIVASIQTLAAMKFRRLKRLIAQRPFRLVICDESHHAAAASYRTAFVHLGFLPPAEASDSEDIEAADFDDVAEMEQALRGWDAKAPKDRLLVGVTATPSRSDAIGLNCVFQSLVFSYPLKLAIQDGWLAGIVPWVVETDTSLDDVRTTAGEFNQKDLANTVNTPKRNQLAVAGWRQYADGLPTIAFTVDVQHAHDLAATFRAQGVRAYAVSGETPRDERRQLFSDFLARRFDVLANCMIVSEGTDLPLTECVLMAKPTKSATLFAQCVGRGLRRIPGKDRCVLIDVVDVAKRHSLQTAPVLYGLPPGVNAQGDDLRKLEGEMEELREKYPNFDVDAVLESGRFSLAELGARAASFDIWTVPTLAESIQAAVSMHWIRSGDAVYRLQYPWGDGTEIVTVQKDLLGHWEVVCTLRPHMPEGRPYLNARRHPGEHVPLPQVRQRTLATQVPTDIAALNLAEAFVSQERRQVTRLKDKDAPWRTRPASPKQLSYLAKLRVPHNPRVLTMGQASDLIDLAQARKSARG